MINKKFLTKLLNDNYRQAILAKNAKIIASTSLKLKAYATYIVDKHMKERDDNLRDAKEANYGFCPFDVLMWVANDGNVRKTIFEFNTINHFLKAGLHEKAVDVATCILSELVCENKKDIASFDIDKIEIECKNAIDEYDAMHKKMQDMLNTTANELSGAQA